ncbi:hypothetical protein Btru_047303 [Bulinus truncatus]|nr:hypothetical protein Btru_047303 [Bulinus truncatus]
MDLTTRYLAVAVVLTLSNLVARADDTVMTLSYRDAKIAFSRDTFTRFYKCLCNAVIRSCKAFANTPGWDTTKFEIVHIRCSDFQSAAAGSPKRECHVTQRTSPRELLIQCSVSTSTTKRLQFYPDIRDTNNHCVSDHVKIAWVGGAQIEYFDHTVINLTSYTD